MKRRTSTSYLLLTFATFCLLLQQSSAFAGSYKPASGQNVKVQSSAEAIAKVRAKNLSIGVNLTFLDHHWKGTKEKRFSDFLVSIDVNKRKRMLRDIARAGYRTVRIPICFSAWASDKAPYSWKIASRA